MTADLHHPHDRFFKETFGRPELASNFLQHYLPSEVAARLNLDALEQQQDSFIDPDLQEYFSDLLYRVPLAEGSVYVYILFEHKSYPDRAVGLQLLDYMVRIWRRQRRQEGDIPLAPVIPVLLYHGSTAWQLDTRFESNIAGPAELERYSPKFDFQLIDLSQYTDEQLRGSVMARITLLILKHIDDDNLAEYLPIFADLLRDLAKQSTGVEYIYTFLRYLTGAGRQVTRADVRRLIATVAPVEGDEIMTTLAQQWMEQGIEQGREQGLEQGLEQGREQAAQVIRNSIVVILQQRLDLSAAEQERIHDRLAGISNLSHLEQLLNVHTMQAASAADFLARIDGVDSTVASE